MKKTIASILALATGTAAFGQVSVSNAIVSSDVTTDTVWSGTIILDGTISVKNDALLTINAGTIVRGQPRTGPGLAGAPGALVVTKTGMIDALGDELNPIIFTTAALDANNDGLPDNDGTTPLVDAYFTAATSVSDTFLDADPANDPLSRTLASTIANVNPDSDGDTATCELWGGLIILGEAPTNLGDAPNATPLAGNIEGLTVSSDTEYGGNKPYDNSGRLQYVSVRHGGEVLGTANEINGITLGGVGSGTIVRYCEVYMTWDDGFEWFGGTVNGEYLHVAFAGDDSFDGDQGFSGNLQYLFAVLPDFAMGSGSGDKGFEFDGSDVGETGVTSNYISGASQTAENLLPAGSYSAANFTILGDGGNGSLRLRNDYTGGVYNGAMDNVNQALDIDTDLPVTVNSLVYANTGSIGDITEAGNTDIDLANIVSSTGGLTSKDLTVGANGLNPRPNFGFFGADNTSSITLPAVFEQTGYRGAFEPLVPTLWTTNWTALWLDDVLVD